MSTLIEFDFRDKDRLCSAARALSVPIRIDIIELLYKEPQSILNISESLNIPVSSTRLHVNILEDVGIIRTRKEKMNDVVTRICYVEKYLLHFFLRSSDENINAIDSINIPIGSFVDCKVLPQCGLISQTNFIGTEDDIRSFFMLEKLDAQLIWFASGYLDYKAPNILPHHKTCKQLTLTMELCSEAPGYDESYKSDIYLTINGIDCGHYRSEGDYGHRRGIYTPDFWQNGLTQYGKLVTWRINKDGIFINMNKVANTRIKELNIENSNCIDIRLECREDSEYCGGINLFGEHAGDYNQPIVLTLEH